MFTSPSRNHGASSTPAATGRAPVRDGRSTRSPGAGRPVRQTPCNARGDHVQELGRMAQIWRLRGDRRPSQVGTAVLQRELIRRAITSSRPIIQRNTASLSREERFLPGVRRRGGSGGGALIGNSDLLDMWLRPAAENVADSARDPPFRRLSRTLYRNYRVACVSIVSRPAWPMR